MIINKLINIECLKNVQAIRIQKLKWHRSLIKDRQQVCSLDNLAHMDDCEIRSAFLIYQRPYNPHSGVIIWLISNRIILVDEHTAIHDSLV